MAGVKMRWRQRIVGKGWRRWWLKDGPSLAVVLYLHVLALFAPFNFNWVAFWTAVGLYFVTGCLGITLSYHRNLTHRSFTLPTWLEYCFAYCGVQAVQGTPIDWVSTHRYHHQYTDTERDPHSPVGGFLFGHVTRIFDSGFMVKKCGRPTNAPDLAKQPYYRFIQLTYLLHPGSLALLLYLIGGFPLLVWGMGVRTVAFYHSAWLVNSVCHTWGSRPWTTGDRSTNNWLMAILAFGDGWHNNHHAFEYSARHGLERWELDITWYVVRLLQVLGLATNVKVPSKNHMHKLSGATNGNNGSYGSWALKSN